MIDPTKTYKTRSGLDVRIYAVDGDAGGSFPVHGAIKRGATWCIAEWSADGRCSVMSEQDKPLDLIESRPLVHVKGWVNVYEDTALGGTYETKEKADSGASTGRVACIHVDVTGERL
jgi:hypothetical protein